MMNTQHIIELQPDHISYKPGRHGCYYDPNSKYQTYDWKQCEESGEWTKVNVKDKQGQYFDCDVFSDETFIRLWFGCSTIQQFRASYKANHEKNYAPSEQSCRLRARNIENRLEMVLPPLKNEKVNAAERKVAHLRHLVSDLRVQKEGEQLGIIPPMLH